MVVAINGGETNIDPKKLQSFLWGSQKRYPKFGKLSYDFQFLDGFSV